ncbi:MAG: copper resistance protein NlpE [Anaerolineae bacterium]|nr:copper resistance protein NlpE [Anaerolineae bacterium]
MKWNLVFYQDPQTGDPTTYQLNSTYGLAKPNTNGLVGGGTSISMEGNWTITTGKKNDPEATVYQLNANDSQTTVSFLKVSDDLIHVLNSEKTLIVGNGAWSYTLNRMDNQNPTEISAESRPDPPTRPPEPAMPEGSSVFAVFDGRTPCHAVVLEFTNTAPFPSCLKIKWRLTLYQDSATGKPSTYLFMGTSQYREGSWRIINGMNSDLDAVIYQLYPEDAQEPVSFLKVDENHLYLMDRERNLLIGNELFSYTLSRVEQVNQ